MRRPIVIYYHHIVRVAAPDHLFFRHALTLDRFRREMMYLKSHFAPISVAEMAQRWEQDQPAPKRSVVVTFDDGFRSNLDAARLLHDLSIPACFFITAGAVDTASVPWNLRFVHILSTRSRSTATRNGRSFDLMRPVQRRRWQHRTREELIALPPKPRQERLDELAEALGSTPLPQNDFDYTFLSSEDLREIQRLGMTIGCHGETHENLPRCNSSELYEEMIRSKERLEGWLGESVDFFSYPDGRFNREARDLAGEHFRMAFAADVVRGRAQDRWAFPRLAGDGQAIKRVLSWRYPWRQRITIRTKQVLGMG